MTDCALWLCAKTCSQGVKVFLILSFRTELRVKWWYKSRCLAWVIAITSYWHQPQERALSLFDDCFQREKETLQDPTSFTQLHVDCYNIPLWGSTFWRERLEPEESSLSAVPNLGPCCILLLSWHNCDFKGKWKSSVSYPCWCCMLSCNADLVLFSRGLEIGTSTATFEVGHGLLTDVAAVLHALHGNQKRDSYSLYKLPC